MDKREKVPSSTLENIIDIYALCVETEKKWYKQEGYTFIWQIYTPSVATTGRI